MHGALEGFRVLDLSQFLSGPRCTQLLAQAGAEVIKIEPPAGEAMRMLTRATGTERMMSLVNTGKQCMVLDLKKRAAREVFRRLVKVSDVVVENFAPGTMARFGLGYEALRAIHPGLVYARITGFGSTGPDADLLAFDIVAQATGGIMDAYGIPDRPPGVFFGDLVSGAYCANGILAALLHRYRSGLGQMVDISMQDVMYFHHFSAQCHRALEPVQQEIRGILGKPLDRLFSDPEDPVPFWYVYPARDGYVVVVALTDDHWNRLMVCIGRSERVGDERFQSIVARVRNAREGVEMVASWMRERSVDEIVQALQRAQVPCGPVLDKAGVNRHRQLRARGMLAAAPHASQGEIPVPGCPIHLTETPGHVGHACPDVGTHTEPVLRNVLGLSTEEIRRLREQGAF